MVETAYRISDRPSVVRYPRAAAYGAEVLKDLFNTELVRGELPSRGTALPIGKGRVVRRGRADAAYTACVLSIGTRLHDSVLAARSLEALHGDLGVTVADARFMKPLDEELIAELARSHDVLVTVEEGSKGGFGNHVLHYLSEAGILDGGAAVVRSMVIPDIWIEQGTQKEQYDIAGLDEAHIAAKVASLVQTVRARAEQRHSNRDEQVSSTGSQATLTSGGSTVGVFTATAPFQQPLE